jgi:hypothetical protein
VRHHEFVLRSAGRDWQVTAVQQPDAAFTLLDVLPGLDGSAPAHVISTTLFDRTLIRKRTNYP